MRLALREPCQNRRGLVAGGGGFGLRHRRRTGGFVLDLRLVADASPITYDGEKPAQLLAEDKVIGARKLGIRPDAVRITPVDEVFKAAPRR